MNESAKRLYTELVPEDLVRRAAGTGQEVFCCLVTRAIPSPIDAVAGFSESPCIEVLGFVTVKSRLVDVVTGGTIAGVMKQLERAVETVHNEPRTGRKVHT